MEGMDNIWEGIIKKYQEEIVKIADTDNNGVVYFDYRDISLDNPDLADRLIKNPKELLTQLVIEMRTVLHPDQEDVVLTPRIRNLLDCFLIGIRDIRSKDIGRLAKVKGIVRKASEVRPRMIFAKYRCERCEKTLLLEQDWVMTEPIVCPKEVGGCGRPDTAFKLLEDESTYIDEVRFEIQERPEGLRAGEQPQRLTCIATHDLVGVVHVGDHVEIIGSPRSIQRFGKGKRTTYDIYFDVNSIKKENDRMDAITLNDEDMKDVLSLSKEDVISRFKESIAPSIYGMDMEKEVLALQLFGGVRKEGYDGTNLRGDIHCIMVGDPGTAKSQLLKAIHAIAPRSVFTSGKGASGVGLTASCVKDSGDDKWSLEAGALVLGDGGIVVIDEFEKISEEDRKSIHEAMEQQIVHVNKASIQAELRSQCSILAAANPKLGRFARDEYIPDQINIPIPILSRFDVIFTVFDKPGEESDKHIATHILDTHANRVRPDVDSVVANTISINSMRKYISYAKNITPYLSKEAREVIHEYYVKIRSKASINANMKMIPMTPRQLEAIIRLSEARARSRLAEEVTGEDVLKSIDIYNYFLKSVGGGDVDVIMSGIGATQRDRIKIVLDCIRKLDKGTGVNEGEVLKTCTELGYTQDKVEETIRKLKEVGEIYYPKIGVLKTTR